jgi:hypothetical protein
MPEGGKLTIETSNTEMDAAFVRRYLSSKDGRIRARHGQRYRHYGLRDTDPHLRACFTTKPKDAGTGLATVYGS